MQATGSGAEEQEPTAQPEQKVSLPKDLLPVEVDSEQKAEGLSESYRTGMPHPGFTDKDAPKKKPISLVLLVIAAVTALVVGLIGYVRPRSFSAVVMRALFPSAPLTTLVDSGNGLVLMLEQDGDLGRVMVQRSGRGGWLLVSQDDTTATNPMLSPTGRDVAYVSKRNGGQVIAVSLITDTRCYIGTNRIADIGKNAGLGSMKLCSWTPIAWSPKGDRIAFFACAEDDSFSVAMVADSFDPNVAITTIGQSKTEIAEARQIKWLDDTKLIISTPGKSRSTVETLDVP